MDQIKEYIISAEKKWLDQLFDYCKILFVNVQIPSHDHMHHLRVWKYAKEIIQVLSLTHKIDEKLVESCLIASFFHDTGLTITLNENHGLESRRICQRFFDENSIVKPSNFEEILSVIELHDDKNYKTNSKPNPCSVFSILCSADDLDAFGKIGVIRYTEIYLLRGISMQELPQLVINNLDKRFAYFENVFGNYPALYQKQKLRYLVTKNFFEDLLKEKF